MVFAHGWKMRLFTMDMNTWINNMLPLRAHFQYNGVGRLKVNECKNICRAYTEENWPEHWRIRMKALILRRIAGCKELAALLVCTAWTTALRTDLSRSPSVWISFLQLCTEGPFPGTLRFSSAVIRDSSASKGDPGCVFEREREICLCIRVGHLEMQSIVLSKNPSLLILFPPYFLLLQSPTLTKMHLYAKYKVCLSGLYLLKQTMLEVGLIGELDKGMKWHCRQENMHISPRIMLHPGIVGDVIWLI